MQPNAPSSDWFLAQLKPNSHQIAERHLTRQGFQSFLPLEECTTRSRGRFRTALRPLFPGYVFVKFSAACGGWRAINATRGVTRLVGFGDRPAPVSADLVEAIRSRCDTAGQLLVREDYAKGDVVRLRTGPFAEFAATVERISPDRRVCVLLDLMGRQARVAVPPDGLRRI